MRKPVPLRERVMRAERPVKEPQIKFSGIELMSIVFSMFSIVFAFQIFGVSEPGLMLGIVLGITLHEIFHKVSAQMLGFQSHYKLWELGLVMVIALAIISRGKFVFAAPGFVVTEGIAGFRERGIIAFSGPFANILLAVFFMGIGGALGTSAAYANLLLAGFNLIPLGPLDGSKVYRWSEGVWTLSFVFTVGLGLILLL